MSGRPASSYSSRARSSSPFGSYRKPPSPSYSSTSSTASSYYGGGGRHFPRSSPASVSRSTTPGRGQIAPPAPVGYDDVAGDSGGGPLGSGGVGESISVTVRLRPLSDRERYRGDEIAWYEDGERVIRNEYNAATFYAFDRVFGPATTTRSVYDVAARPVVKSAMEGINGTVFAYGVTSSGKTHTMHGDIKSPGIIPLAIKDVFSIIQDTPGREFLLRVSYLEIYNEVINDLLDPTGQNLRVREDAQGTYVEGIKEEVVLSPGHALSFIAAGEEHRHVGSNNFNLFSSRSHTIFTLMIESSARGDEYDGVMYSQLNLIDLAGSESSKTETTGLRRKEGSYINKSLLTLGTVIGKLSEGRATHIPYRDSKLTRLLQSSLSGHGLVSLICTITPASSNMEETHNTLKFASRAKQVEIYASRNKIIDEKSLIKKYQKEISNLKQELDQLKKGIIVGPSQEEIISLRQKLEEGQVKMQYRLEEEEEAKAALMSRIQRLTKLILVSTKNTIPGCLTDLPGHQYRLSLGEDDKLEMLRDTSTVLLESGSTKHDLSYALSDSLDMSSNSVHRISPNMLSELQSTTSSSVTDPMQSGMTIADQMDLLAEQAKMLAGEIALSTSTLKRLVEQSANDPDSTKVQIQNLENEIQEKQQQMKRLEQRIAETGKTSMANASLVDMQQTVTKLMTQCSEKGFELELKSADNRILQEQLQKMSAENKELQEKVFILQQQLDSPQNGKFSEVIDEVRDLKNSVQSLEAENEKLNIERNRLTDESHKLLKQNQQLAEEASYAKELASSAAVELKNLAEEVTKLSLQNAKLAEDLLAAQEMSYSRTGNGAGRKLSESKNDSLKISRKTRPSSRAGEVGMASYDETDSWNIELDQLKKELQVMKQREVVLEAELSERDQIKEAYMRKFDEAKQREKALENELAGMWVLVAKLKRSALTASELSVNPRSNIEDNNTNSVKENDTKNNDTVSNERELSNGSLKQNTGQIDQNSQFEPLLVRLKAKIQEMKEKDFEPSGNSDVNSHVCKVCFESPAAAVLLPCRHFCLCKPCSLACLECPLCRIKIEDRIITFAS